MFDRALLADFAPFSARSLGLVVDAFARGPLRINGVVERPQVIQGNAYLTADAASLPIEDE